MQKKLYSIYEYFDLTNSLKFYFFVSFKYFFLFLSLITFNALVKVSKYFQTQLKIRYMWARWMRFFINLGVLLQQLNYIFSKVSVVSLMSCEKSKFRSKFAFSFSFVQYFFLLRPFWNNTKKSQVNTWNIFFIFY